MGCQKGKTSPLIRTKDIELQHDTKQLRLNYLLKCSFFAFVAVFPNIYIHVGKSKSFDTTYDLYGNIILY